MSNIIVIGWLTLDYIANVGSVPGSGEFAYADELDAACGGRGANQAMAVAALEAPVTMISRVGEDQYAAVLLDELVDIGVDVQSVQQSPSATGLRIITSPMDGQSPSIVTHAGANEFLTVDDINRRAALLQAAPVIAMTAEAPGSVLLRALELADQAGVPSVLTHVPGIELSDRVLGLAGTVVVSAPMAQGLLAPGVATDRPEQAARVLLQRGARTAVLISGQTAYVAQGESIRAVPAQGMIDDEDAVDAFVAGFISGLAQGDELETAVARGIRVAGLLVG